ncbi:MAG TPA: hypothetical protein VFN67_01530 [Polyangiales bacterium]|nr:hypothetical protein [Polyangiales bacterium]
MNTPNKSALLPLLARACGTAHEHFRMTGDDHIALAAVRALERALG